MKGNKIRYCIHVFKSTLTDSLFYLDEVFDKINNLSFYILHLPPSMENCVYSKRGLNLWITCKLIYDRFWWVWRMKLISYFIIFYLYDFSNLPQGHTRFSPRGCSLCTWTIWVLTFTFSGMCMWPSVVLPMPMVIYHGLKFQVHCTPILIL